MKIFVNLTSRQKKIAAFYVAGVAALALFTAYVHFFWPSFDRQLMDIIHQDHGKKFAVIMDFISWWGMGVMMIVPVFAVSVIFLMASYQREAFFTLSVFIADGVNIVLKLLINRSRPQAMDIFPKFQQASFPSGHVVHYAVFFGFILTVMLVSPRIPKALRWFVGTLCVFLIGGVSIARIYLGTHWPSDILAAYVLGFVMLGGLILLYIKGLAATDVGQDFTSTKKEIIRYCIVTPLVGVTDFGFYYLSKLFLPISAAKAISFVCAGIAGYLLNKYWTFCKQKKCYPEMARYWIVELVLLGYNVLANRVILNLWPSAIFLALAIASVSTAVLSFTLKKWWVFKTS